MNNDGSTYTTVETVTGTGKVGSTITPAVKTYPDFTSPSQKTFTLTANPSSNVFEYKYTRNCYGTTCDYCTKGSKIGTCLYNNASKLGLWNSGLSTDTTHNNLRYTGTKSSEPKNYICIGSTKDCTGYHLHRIIGVFETAHRIKVIYPTSMGNNYYYNAGYSKITYAFTSKKGAIRNKVQGLLTNANLGYDTYITGTTKWSDMMETVTKYNELNNSMWKKTSTDWLGYYYSGKQKYSDKVYLTSAADMLLSTGSTSLTFQNNYYTIKNSWLHANKKEWIADIWNTGHSYFLGGNEGGGTQNGKLCANSTSGVTNATNCGGEKYSGYFTSSSSTTSDGAYYYRHGYRPNFEMISTTLFCGGSGTSSDPYKVGSGSC